MTEPTFRYTTSEDHCVTYYVGRRGFVADCFGADTSEGLDAAKAEVWEALAAYRADPIPMTR